MTWGTAARTVQGRWSWRLRQGEPKAEGTGGCWADMGHNVHESPRQRNWRLLR